MSAAVALLCCFPDLSDLKDQYYTVEKPSSLAGRWQEPSGRPLKSFEDSPGSLPGSRKEAPWRCTGAVPYDLLVKVVDVALQFSQTYTMLR